MVSCRNIHGGFLGGQNRRRVRFMALNLAILDFTHWTDLPRCENFDGTSVLIPVESSGCSWNKHNNRKYQNCPRTKCQLTLAKAGSIRQICLKLSWACYLFCFSNRPVSRIIPDRDYTLTPLPYIRCLSVYLNWLRAFLYHLINLPPCLPFFCFKHLIVPNRSGLFDS